MKNHYKNRGGFTLVEILVVIAIIGIIAGIATISFSLMRERSRDIKRVKDIETIQTALKLYFYNEGTYPASLTFGGLFQGSSSPTLYMNNVPNNPQPRNDDGCSDTNYTYTSSTSTDYQVSFCLGSTVGSLSSGPKCLTSTGISNEGCPAEALTPQEEQLADIQTIESAMNAMWNANGYYFFNDSGLYSYTGDSLVGGVRRRGNCSTLGTDGNGTSDPCPAQSDWCIKLGGHPYDENSSAGTNCDTGTVYLRNIPLNNHLPNDVWTTGWYPYKFTIINNYNGVNDYFRIKWRAVGSATYDTQSDHFVDGVPTNCHSDPGYGGSSGTACEGYEF